MESAISASAEVNQPSVVESCAVPSGEKIKKRNVKRRIVYHHRLLWYGRLVILLFGIKTGNKKSLVHLPRQLHSSRLVLSLSLVSSKVFYSTDAPYLMSHLSVFLSCLASARTAKARVFEVTKTTTGKISENIHTKMDRFDFRLDNFHPTS